jgi:hypothetical protein
MPGKQASELPLPEGLVPLCLQQLSWLLEVHTQKQIDPKASAALWTPDDSSLLALLPVCTTLNLLLSARSLLPQT